jgi:preprotein translocase subunit SecA
LIRRTRLHGPLLGSEARPAREKPAASVVEAGPRSPAQSRGSLFGTWLLGKTADAHPVKPLQAAAMVLGVREGFQSRIPAQFFRWLREINRMRDAVFGKSDEELRSMLASCREKVRGGAELTEVLPMVYAIVREATRRPDEPHQKVIEQFEVQLLGAMALGKGAIARLRTGEGKTFVIPLAAVLFSLLGEGVHIGTRDPFLAQDGVEKTKQIFERLGLTVGLLDTNASIEEQQAACRADITYGVASSFVYAWLSDQYAVSKEDQVLRGLHACILDEVDLILAEEALQPLQLSAGAEERASPAVERQLEVAQRIAERLGPDEVRIELDRGASVPVYSPKGYEAVEGEVRAALADPTTAAAFGFDPEHLDLENFSLWGRDPDDEAAQKVGSELASVHLRMDNAVHARLVLERGRDYIVQDEKVIIVDPNTGHPNPQSRWSRGLMEAVEFKEKVPVRGDAPLLGMIAYQSFYAMYDRLAGTTGTDEGLVQEFSEAWGLDSYHVDAHRPLIRNDEEDRVFLHSAPRHVAAIGDIVEQVERGRPILVGNRRVIDSKDIADLLESPGKARLLADVAVHSEALLREALGMLEGGSALLAELTREGEEIEEGARLDSRDRIAELMDADEAGKRRFARLLDDLGLPATKILDHGSVKNALLNAENASEAAERVKTAGLPGGVCSTTNVAGRGVDIELANAVKAAGGLHITGIAHQDDGRQDMQLRGRAGRQGDPGSSRFFVSLDDDLLTRYLPPRRLEQLAATLPGYNFSQPTGRARKKWTKAVKDAQSNKEANASAARKQMATFAKFLHVQWQDILVNQERIRELRRIPVEVLDEYQQEFTTLFFAWELLPGIPKDVDPYNIESAWRGGKIPAQWTRRDTERWVASQEAIGATLPIDKVRALIRDINPAFAAKIEGAKLTLRQVRVKQREALQDLSDRIYARLEALAAELVAARTDPKILEKSGRTRALEMLASAVGEVDEASASDQVKAAFDRSMRGMALGIFNEAWKQYLENVDQLQTIAINRATGRSSPAVEFAHVATDAFMDMKFRFRDELVLKMVRSLRRFLEQSEGTSKVP